MLPLTRSLPQVLVPNLINYQPKSEQRKTVLLLNRIVAAQVSETTDV
jgi:hypothetical protein